MKAAFTTETQSRDERHFVRDLSTVCSPSWYGRKLRKHSGKIKLRVAGKSYGKGSRVVPKSKKQAIKASLPLESSTLPGIS